MTTEEYLKGVLVTESLDIPETLFRLSNKRAARLLHASMGLTTESGEFSDQLKKHLFYGTDLDEVNLVEELGDLLWYIGVAIDALGSSFEKVMEINNLKLSQRYKSGFSKEEALNRDLDKENDAVHSK